MTLAKAILQKLKSNFEDVDNPDHKVTVQFNPETLKVTYSASVNPPGAPRNEGGTPAQQVVSTGTRKLSLQLWFDVTAEQPRETQEKDVRRLTEKVAYFITPDETNPNSIPAVRFTWGSFKFDGVMESLEESLEFFSAEGIPLRASMSLGLTQQKLTTLASGVVANTPLGGPAAGTRKLKAASAGKTLPGIAAAQGKGDNWQDIAAANNIENPRLLQPGQLIDMDARLPQPPFGNVRF